MYTLGLSYGFHDASAALVKDGRVVAMAAEERFTRQKHDDHFPLDAVGHCLAAAGIGPEELARVVYHESPGPTFTRVLASCLAAFPGSRAEFVTAMKAWLGRKLWVDLQISRKLGVAPEKIEHLTHHQSHAAQAFLGSGLARAAVLTVDAVGEWATTTLSRARRDGRGVTLETVETFEFPHSLGLVYSAFTAYLGFLPMDGECSTMALAAYGEPVYAGEVRKMIRARRDGAYEVDQSYFELHRFHRPPYTQKLLDALGPARAPKAALLTPEARRYADVAASVQLVLEEVILGLVRRLHRATGEENLCFAGGVALNCVANTRILTEGPFATLYVPPDPGDGGAAAGAALLGEARAAGGARMSGVAAGGAPRGDGLGYAPYLGPAGDCADLLAMLPHLEPRRFRRHVKLGYTPSPYETWDWHVADDEAALVAAVADLLHRGHLVGWCQGPAESGPRALGARSLLMRPDDLALAQRMSTHVKDRAPYRPYALAMTLADAPKILDAAPDRLAQTPFKWMQLAWPVRDAARPAVAAGLHVDGTTRPQVCAPADHPRFHALLEAYGRLSGLACLINTSFNESGAPLVTSPLDALAVFARTDLDALVWDRLVIRKRR